MGTMTNATVPATRAETADMTVLGSLPILSGEDRALSGSDSDKVVMELNSKNDRRQNAIKHGAFAKALVIFNENKDDFDELHQSCVKELKPSGRMEDEVVLAIAKYMWSKHRIQRFFCRRSKLAAGAS